MDCEASSKFSFDSYIDQWAKDLRTPLVTPSKIVEFDMPYYYSEEYYNKAFAKGFLMQPFGSIGEPLPLTMLNDRQAEWQEKSQLALKYYKQLCDQPGRMPSQTLVIKNWQRALYIAAIGQSTSVGEEEAYKFQNSQFKINNNVMFEEKHSSALIPLQQVQNIATSGQTTSTGEEVSFRYQNSPLRTNNNVMFEEKHSSAMFSLQQAQYVSATGQSSSVGEQGSYRFQNSQFRINNNNILFEEKHSSAMFSLQQAQDVVATEQNRSTVEEMYHGYQNSPFKVNNNVMFEEKKEHSGATFPLQKAQDTVYTGRSTSSGEEVSLANQISPFRINNSVMVEKKHSSALFPLHCTQDVGEATGHSTSTGEEVFLGYQNSPLNINNNVMHSRAMFSVSEQDLNSNALVGPLSNGDSNQMKYDGSTFTSVWQS